MFKIGGAQAGVQHAPERYRNIAGLLGNHNGKGIGGLRNSKRRPVAQAQRPGHVTVMTNRQYTAGAAYAVMINYHRAVMQGGVFEEDILDQARVDISIDDVTTFLIRLQRHLLTDHYQRPGLGLRHVHASIHYRQDILAGIRLRTRFLMPEQILQESPSLMVAKLDKKSFYLILEQDHKHQQTNPHKLIQDCTYQLKVQYLGGEHPHHNERKHTKEYIDSAAFLHYPVKIKQEQRHYGYIKRISNTKLIQGLKD